MKDFILILGMFTLSLGLFGCNTVDGVGRDIERAGEVLQDL